MLKTNCSSAATTTTTTSHTRHLGQSNSKFFSKFPCHMYCSPSVIIVNLQPRQRNIVAKIFVRFTPSQQLSQYSETLIGTQLCGQGFCWKNSSKIFLWKIVNCLDSINPVPCIKLILCLGNDLFVPVAPTYYLLHWSCIY